LKFITIEDYSYISSRVYISLRNPVFYRLGMQLFNLTWVFSHPELTSTKISFLITCRSATRMECLLEMMRKAALWLTALPVLVGLEVVAVDASALEALLEVVANLRAAAGRVALVEVDAGDGVVGQHLTLGAGADGARRRLLARVGAEAGLVLALGQVAAGTLVGSVRTVRLAVAHRRQVHAAPTHARTLPLARVATRSRRAARVTRVLV
jgi:hypothetical protein